MDVGTKYKILSIDEEKEVQYYLKRIFLQRGYKFYSAQSGRDGMTQITNGCPDLVLLDYEMPVVDGRQVLEMIRTETEFSDVPVIFLTSKDDRESVMQVMALKPEGYLLKTMEPARIIAEVDAFFERQKAKLFD